jgi:hypothetical protein
MSPELFYPGCKVHGRTSGMHGGLDDDEEEDEENLSERDALNPVSVEAAQPLNGGFGYAGGGRVLSPAPPAPSSFYEPFDHSNCSEQLHKTCACVNFIAEHTKAREEETKVCTAIILKYVLPKIEASKIKMIPH